MWDENILDLSCPSKTGTCGCQRHVVSGSLMLAEEVRSVEGWRRWWGGDRDITKLLTS
jgi:hypothetical protein